MNYTRKPTYRSSQRRASVASKYSKLSKKSRGGDQKSMDLFNCYKTEQIEQFREIFKMYDRNNTGSITSKDLKFLLRGLGDNVSEDQVEQVLQEMDQDGNGTIDFQEFLLYMLEKVNAQCLLNDIIEIFQVFDRDSTGYINLSDLKVILGDIVEPEVLLRFYEEADVDQEGQIHYQTYLGKILKED